MVTLIESGEAALNDVVASIRSANKIPGFVLGATSADKELYFNASGHRVVGDPASGEVNADTVFWICSMTKMIAHIAALQLIEQGQLSVDDPVSQFFPQFHHVVVVSDINSPHPTYTPAKTQITIQHLLNFSSGLFYPSLSSNAPPSMPGPYSGRHDKQDPHANFFALLQGDRPGIPIKFEPGTDCKSLIAKEASHLKSVVGKVVYGFSSDVLGFIVEKITRQTLEKYFQDNIFGPLGIKGSFYLTPELKKNFLTLSQRTSDGFIPQYECKIIEQDPNKVSRHMGGVGLYMSLRDYLTLLRHILQIYKGKAVNPILSLDSVRSMFVGASTEEGIKSLDLFSISAPTDGSSWSTALAVSSVDAPWGRKKGSAFWSGWAGTYYFMDPTTEIAGIFGTQLIGETSGSRDQENLKAFTEFEKTLYASLSQ